MSDTTITAEERAEIRRRFEILRRGHPITGSFSLGVHMDGYLRNYAHGFKVNFIGLLNALEQAEAQLAAALQVNAVRQAEVTAEIINSMMAGITGKKESVRVEVDGFQCPYCNEISKTIEAATAHDAICPKHPAVMRAERAEANVARLTKMADFMAQQMADVFSTDEDGRYVLTCPVRTLRAADHDCDKISCPQCWQEAAAIAAWNSLPRRPDYNDVDCAGCPERRRGYLTWTTETPKVEGWYWFSACKGHAVCILVCADGKAKYAKYHFTDAELLGGKWAGPIPAPPEPEES